MEPNENDAQAEELFDAKQGSRELRAELRRAYEERDVQEKPCKVFRQRARVKYRCLLDHRPRWSIRMMRLNQDRGTGFHRDRAHRCVPREAAIDGLSVPARPDSKNWGKTGWDRTKIGQEIANPSGLLYAENASWRLCRLFASTSEAP